MIKGELVAKMQRLLEERVPFVIATVVNASKPASVRPGDSALVLADGTIDGFVGGVCAQGSVRLYAARALESGDALLLRLVPGLAEGEDASRGGRGRLAQPVSEWRGLGDLPRAAARGAADRGRPATRRSPARWRRSRPPRATTSPMTSRRRPTPRSSSPRTAATRSRSWLAR